MFNKYERSVAYVADLFYFHQMKWYPIWKSWYFSREQRLGIITMVLMIMLILLLDGPVLNYLVQQKEKDHAKQNQIKWAQLQLQIDSNRLLAKTENEHRKKGHTAKNIGKNTPEKHEPALILLDINKASASEWKQLKGIGEVLSKRIVSYRNKLGGFCKIEQIQEVYGISDSLFFTIRKQLKIKKHQPRQLNINQAMLEELQEHPYISKTLAKQITGYREKINPFESVEEMKKLYAMDDSLYNKLFPYLTIY